MSMAKIIFQRIRRDIKTGLNNLAHMCMDYPENDIILEYANNLYEYKMSTMKFHFSKESVLMVGKCH